MREFATLLIRAYRYLISPFFPPSCRFYPSCSEYALQAIQQHGLLRGTYLGTRRICRCHPLSEGGFDPVPTRHNPHQNSSTLSADSALAASDNNNNG